MKRPVNPLTRTIPLLTLALLSGAGCSEETEASGTDAAVGEELVDVYDETRNYLDLTREELVVELEERQAEFAALERELNARASSVAADAEDEWSERRAEIERLRTELATGILDLKTASEESWKDARKRLADVTRSLRRELAAAALPDEQG